MTRTILAVLLSTALASPAAALSCLRPSVQASYQAADAAEAQYVLSVGRLQLLPGETIPDTTGTDPNDRQGYTVRTRFDGKLADAGGFGTDAAFPVTVEVECAGAWCGGVPLDRVLLFLERRGEENVLVQGPCPRFALSATPEVVAGAAACLKGEDCTPPS
ncbi:hypothetical protein MWU52_13945 [Jannaschia sp. S6380]|uniref:hypothetical protein n=1 Tax=Jannaschia sp. S6380 TaxID=2926408 RepID=UPI001FF56B71|nr:hypothetical protein [Jannaschia sp. S6380]MCK0168657.1 hypothetical protein [Jannaschia sp. S6380]